jgi:hypothetical protein
LNFDSPSIPSEKEEESEILWENVTRIEKTLFLSVLEINAKLFLEDRLPRP